MIFVDLCFYTMGPENGVGAERVENIQNLLGERPLTMPLSSLQ